MTRSIKTTSRNQTAHEKAGSGRAVECTDCLHARLIQYDAPRDPLLAECTRKPQPYSSRFPYQVEVARAKKCCIMYEHTDEVREPQLRAKVRNAYTACHAKTYQASGLS